MQHKQQATQISNKNNIQQTLQCAHTQKIDTPIAPSNTTKQMCMNNTQNKTTKKNEQHKNQHRKLQRNTKHCNAQQIFCNANTNCNTTNKTAMEKHNKYKTHKQYRCTHKQNENTTMAMHKTNCIANNTKRQCTTRHTKQKQANCNATQTLQPF